MVEWWGYRTDMPAVFAVADVICLPSYREGLPTVLIEAAACAIPNVTTDVPGCREVVCHQENGLLVPPRDSAALVEALRILVRNPTLRRRFGQRGRDLVLEHLTVEHVVEQTPAAY